MVVVFLYTTNFKSTATENPLLRLFRRRKSFFLRFILKSQYLEARLVSKLRCVLSGDGHELAMEKYFPNRAKKTFCVFFLTSEKMQRLQSI